MSGILKTRLEEPLLVMHGDQKVWNKSYFPYQVLQLLLPEISWWLSSQYPCWWDSELRSYLWNELQVLVHKIYGQQHMNDHIGASSDSSCNFLLRISFQSWSSIWLAIKSFILGDNSVLPNSETNKIWYNLGKYLLHLVASL